MGVQAWKALINALILPSHGSKQIHGFMHWTCQCPVHYRQLHFKNIDYVPSHLWDVAVWVGVYLRVGVGVGAGVALAVNIVGCGWENCHRLSTAAINNTKCHVRASVRCVTRPGPKGPHRDNPVKSSNLRIAAFVTGLDSVRRQNGPIKYRSFISHEHQAISIRGTRCLVWNKVSWWRKWLAMNNQTGWGLNSTLRA